MYRLPISRRTLTVLLAWAVAASACASGSSLDEPEPAAERDSSATTTPTTTPTTTAVAAPAGTTATTDPPPAPRSPSAPSLPTSSSPPTTVDESWRDEAAAWCAAGTDVLLANPFPTSDDDVARYVGDMVVALQANALVTSPKWPAMLTDEPYDLDGLAERQVDALSVASERLAAGNPGTLSDPAFADTAWGALDLWIALTGRVATTLAIAGVRCGPADPARVETASLNVPIVSPWHLRIGFGSVWVSNWAENLLHRIDPETGALQATIETGSTPYLLQPADGRIVLRTDEAYLFVDPATDSISDTLLRSEVGPSAGASWAVDGALWICDGRQVHRYDPTTLERTGTVPLDIDCSNVHATSDLVAVWQSDGVPGDALTAMIDPSTNSVLATLDLPVDVGRPSVIDDRTLFFPGADGSRSVVVDAATGAITSTPDLGRPYVHSNSTAFDGTHLYVLVDGRDILVVEPSTFEVLETIEPMDFDPPFGVQVNALVAEPGVLWVVNDAAGILQRFDRPSGL